MNKVSSEDTTEDAKEVKQHMSLVHLFETIYNTFYICFSYYEVRKDICKEMCKQVCQRSQTMGINAEGFFFFFLSVHQ